MTNPVKKKPAMNLKQTLKSIDPGQEITMTESRRLQATQTLERVLATSDGPSSGAETDLAAARRPARRRPIVRLAIALPVAAALAGAVAVVRAGSGDTYESWTPVAASVSTEDLSVAVDACRTGFADEKPTTMGMDDPSTSSVRVAERRGDFVTVILQRSDVDGVFGSCRVKMPVGATSATVDGVGAGAGGLDPVGPRGVATFLSTEGGPTSEVVGSVGGDVRGVTVHSGDVTVRASVEDGTFVAWWPGELTTPVRYDITLDDGRVLKDVPHTGLYGTD